MLIAWVEKIEKTQTKYPLREARTITVAACDKNICCSLNMVVCVQAVDGRSTVWARADRQTERQADRQEDRKARSELQIHVMYA